MRIVAIALSVFVIAIGSNFALAQDPNQQKAPQQGEIKPKEKRNKQGKNYKKGGKRKRHHTSQYDKGGV